MRKELEEARELISSAYNREMREARVYLVQALATLDRILGQDEAEMVDSAAAAVWNYAQELGDDRMDIDPTKDDCIAIAKAALRALGLMKEGRVMAAKKWKAADTRKLETLMRDGKTSSEIYEAEVLPGYTLRQISAKMMKLRSGRGSSQRDGIVKANKGQVPKFWSGEELEVLEKLMDIGKSAAQIVQTGKLPGRNYYSVRSKMQKICDARERVPHLMPGESADDGWTACSPIILILNNTKEIN